MIALFERFEISMPLDIAEQCSHPGQCDIDVAAALTIPTILEQLNAIDPDEIRAELREYGAWNDEELADDAQNRMRIVWIAAGNIRDNQSETI